MNPQWLDKLKQIANDCLHQYGLKYACAIGRFAKFTLVLNPAPHNEHGFEYLAGEPKQVWQAFVQGKGVLASEPLAYHRGLKVGQNITLATEHGLQALPVLAIYRDYSATQGMLVIPRLLFNRYWQDSNISSIGLKLKPNADAAAVEQQLQRLATQIVSPSPIRFVPAEAFVNFPYRFSTAPLLLPMSYACWSLWWHLSACLAL